MMTARDEVDRAERPRRHDPAMWRHQVAVAVTVARVLAECSHGLREEAALLREEARRLREEAARLRP